MDEMGFITPPSSEGDESYAQPYNEANSSQLDDALERALSHRIRGARIGPIEPLPNSSSTSASKARHQSADYNTTTETLPPDVNGSDPPGAPADGGLPPPWKSTP